MRGADDAGEVLEERDGFEVLAATELVGDPLPRLARVVEVQHRRHRVHPQAVDVELAQPVEGAADEKRPDLVPAVVEDQRPPVLVLALTGIGMLVERRAVEAGQAVGVLGKMPGHPVEDDAEPGPMTGVDQARKSSGVPKRLVGAKKPVTW